jgi:hypothetical protein
VPDPRVVDTSKLPVESKIPTVCSLWKPAPVESNHPSDVTSNVLFAVNTKPRVNGSSLKVLFALSKLYNEAENRNGVANRDSTAEATLGTIRISGAYGRIGIVTSQYSSSEDSCGITD